jgi:hypothetical protein
VSYTPITNFLTDDVTTSLVSLDYAHHLAHSADVYGAFVANAALAAAGTISIVVITPDTTKRAHMVHRAVGSLSTTFDVLEGPTVQDNGATVTTYNKDRDSASASVLKARDGTAGSYTTNPTIDAAGTAIFSETFGGRGGGGESRATLEIILAANTTYAFRLTSNAANNVVGINLTWYEHTHP